MKNVVVLTGAGMSAESGLKTFRDENGLWEGHDVTKVASPEGFKQNPELVLDFYNQRRSQLLNVKPNKGHYNLVKLEKDYHVNIITQNVDNLHEVAGSKNVTHLHGELLKVRSTGDESLIYNWKKDLNLGDTCKKGHQLRPHIVWFGEMVPMLEQAIHLTQKANILIVIGSSMQVYPAASLVHYAPSECPIFFIDPKPTVTKNSYGNLTVIKDFASSGTDKLLTLLNY